MFNLGPFELILILFILILFFGVGRLSKISGELGSAIRSFRKNLQGQDQKEANETKKVNKTQE